MTKTKLLILFSFFSLNLFGQKNNQFYQDGFSISIGTLGTTNKSISTAIYFEKVIFKTQKNYYSLNLGAGGISFFDKKREDETLIKLSSSFLISERFKRNQFIFSSIGTNYYPLHSTVRTQNGFSFFPFFHLGYKKLWSKTMFRLFAGINYDVNDPEVKISPIQLISEYVIPKKWFLGIGTSIGYHF